MRGIFFLLCASIIIFTGSAASASTSKVRCFNHRQVSDAKLLMLDAEVKAYADRYYRLFEHIGVDACMDAARGIEGTPEWLRQSLPKGRTLDKILRTSAAHHYKPWSLLLAIYSRVLEANHQKEEAQSKADERNAEHE